MPANKLQRVCSTACLSLWMDAQRAKKRSKVRKVSKARSRAQVGDRAATVLRVNVRSRDGDVCRLCGRHGTEVHHVVFRSQGGADHESNLILLCLECHHFRAHGDQSRLYRKLFLAYVWMLHVEGRKLFGPEIIRVCKRRGLLDDVELEQVRRAA